MPGARDGALRETTLLTVNQDYSRFQFYSVRSREEITRFVDGDSLDAGYAGDGFFDGHLAVHAVDLGNADGGLGHVFSS